MKIDISTKNITLDEPLRFFIEEKIGGLDKLIGNSTGQAKVEIGMPSKHHRSGEVFSAEVNLSLGGKLLRATCIHEDLRNAIVDVKDELQAQIKKFKEKRTDLARQPHKE
ncbi:MAG: ribosome-associated translation inhibitor RaiA [Candidatus Yanofskybacteria bacterium]|nr:ribosome-associated translation inhibitor RaiA [Candidatus Yanofskybacteria bacterium]